MGGSGRLAIILIGVGFPVYLLWRGRLASYLALAKVISSTGVTIAPADAISPPSPVQNFNGTPLPLPSLTGP
jgi:hypothetical protein